MSTSGSNHVTGWTCQQCGQFVLAGSAHQCWIQPPGITLYPSVDGLILAELRTIRELLEKLAKQ